MANRTPSDLFQERVERIASEHPAALVRAREKVGNAPLIAWIEGERVLIAVQRVNALGYGTGIADGSPVESYVLSAKADAQCA